MTPVGRRRWLTHALDRLPARERRIVEARRLADPAVSLEQLGCELGVSKERVRQLGQRDVLALAERTSLPLATGVCAPSAPP